MNNIKKIDMIKNSFGAHQCFDKGNFCRDKLFTSFSQVLSEYCEEITECAHEIIGDNLVVIARPVHDQTLEVWVNGHADAVQQSEILAALRCAMLTSEAFD